MLVVLDTSVIVAAMRSPGGASAALLLEALAGRVQLAASPALCFEYEAVCQRPEHAQASGLTAQDIDIFLDAVIDLVEPVRINFSWRPQLRDPGDEFVLEAAVNAGAETIVTFNRRDFLPAATQFGVSVVTPADILRSMMR